MFQDENKRGIYPTTLFSDQIKKSNDHLNFFNDPRSADQDKIFL